MSVEVYEERFRVVAYHRLDDGQYSTDGDLWKRGAEVDDDVGTKYLWCGGGAGGNELWFRTYQDFEPPPPPGARTLTIRYRCGTDVEVSLIDR